MWEWSASTAHTIHFIFEWLAILTGVQVYRLIKKRRGQARITEGTSFAVALGCILGAAIGNKLMFVLEMPFLWSQHGWLALLQGQSIVGGLLGGLLGVEIAKKIVGVTHSTGDDFIVPLIVGTIVGRIGCFLAGLHDGTFGNPTTLPWGVDFGDGLPRHPTQLYDMTVGQRNQAYCCGVIGSRSQSYQDCRLSCIWRLICCGVCWSMASNRCRMPIRWGCQAFNGRVSLRLACICHFWSKIYNNCNNTREPSHHIRKSHEPFNPPVFVL
jgi:hypothetical protein